MQPVGLEKRPPARHTARLRAASKASFCARRELRDAIERILGTLERLAAAGGTHMWFM